MKRLIDFARSFIEQTKTATTPELKKALCEDAKTVISLVLSGPWANLATHLVTDLEKTIK